MMMNLNTRKGLFVFCLLAAPMAANGGPVPTCPVGPFIGIPPGGGISVTTSYTCSLGTVQTTEVSDRVDQYITRITAHLLGDPPVYDQTFNRRFSDPVVQDAILDAQSALLGLGFPLSILGPNLLSSSIGFVGSSSNTVIDSSVDNVFTDVTAAIGPTSILIGDLGVCAGINITGPTTGVPFGCTPGAGTPFLVASATANIHTNLHTLTEIFQTTTFTDTFLTTQHYNLIGGPAAPAAVPEPGTVLLAAAGLVGLGLYRTKKRRCLLRENW